MGLLQYTSNEMYSSTELIRKSKGIFDKLTSKEIEKAIILRDGKPSFMLLEFKQYEELINEYLQLKDEVEKKKKELKNVSKNTTDSNEIDNIQKIDSPSDINEIDDDELEKALAKIEEMDIDFDDTINENKPSEDQVAQNIKEFWD